VLIRRTNHRLEQIARRLEVLEGYLIVYLDLRPGDPDHPQRGTSRGSPDAEFSFPTCRRKRSSTCASAISAPGGIGDPHRAPSTHLLQGVCVARCGSPSPPGGGDAEAHVEDRFRPARREKLELVHQTAFGSSSLRYSGSPGRGRDRRSLASEALPGGGDLFQAMVLCADQPRAGGRAIRSKLAERHDARHHHLREDVEG